MERELQVRPWGAFHRYAGSLRIAVAPGATDAEARTALAAVLPDDEARQLLARSALATDERLLGDHEALPAQDEISVLPPVAGG